MIDMFGLRKGIDPRTFPGTPVDKRPQPKPQPQQPPKGK